MNLLPPRRQAPIRMGIVWCGPFGCFWLDGQRRKKLPSLFAVTGRAMYAWKQTTAVCALPRAISKQVEFRVEYQGYEVWQESPH